MSGLPSCLSHSPGDDPVICFYLLAIGSDASMRIYVRVLGGRVPLFLSLSSCSYIGRSGIAGLWGSFMFTVWSH